MCGNCRLWYQRASKQQKLQFIVADPRYIRVFNLNGRVDIYQTSDLSFVRTVPADVPPAAGRRTNYIGVDW
jgi:hypothetical protein